MRFTACAVACSMVIGCGRVGFDDVVVASDMTADGSVLDGQSQAPSALGTFVGGPSFDWGYGMASDGDGYLAVVGWISGSITLGTTTLPFAGATDILVALLDPAGGLIWAYSFGGAESDQGRAIAMDESGAVYITGYVTGPIDFGGGVLTPVNDDVFVASFARDGSHRWSRLFGGSAMSGTFGSDRGVAIAARGDLVVVGGTCRGIVDFGGGPSCNIATGFDAFILALDRDGAYRWDAAYGNAGAGTYSAVHAISITADRVIVGGYYSGQPDLGGGPLPASNGQDGVIASFDHTGNHQWDIAFGASSFDWPFASAIGTDGHYYVVGYYAGNAITVGGTTLPYGGGGDAFIASYSVDGSPRWGKGFGGTGCEELFALHPLPSGELVAAGHFENTIDLGTGSMTARGPGRDALVIRFDGSGSVLSAVALDRPGGSHVNGIAGVDRSSLFMTGYDSRDATGCGGSTSSTMSGGFIDRLPAL